MVNHGSVKAGDFLMAPKMRSALQTNCIAKTTKKPMSRFVVSPLESNQDEM
jgi:hypothetical protein